MTTTSLTHGPLPPAAKARLAAEVLRDYVRVRRLLREQDVRDVLDRLRGDAPGDRAGGAEADDQDVSDGVRLARVVHRVLAPLPADTSCLRRSLVLTAALARRGIPGVLVIGVRPGEDAQFGAHAWVEIAGRPVLDPGDGEFARLVEL